MKYKKWLSCTDFRCLWGVFKIDFLGFVNFSYFIFVFSYICIKKQLILSFILDVSTPSPNAQLKNVTDFDGVFQLSTWGD